MYIASQNNANRAIHKQRVASIGCWYESSVRLIHFFLWADFLPDPDGFEFALSPLELYPCIILDYW